ncbi:MAG: peptide chain release factor 2, partial [Defluviitaleaceae bacterium]|nr:peptide chain release factor 2 [Defluviitaleaceae bacterium]
CQNERSQHKNRDVAMKMLRAKLLDIKMAEKNEILAGVRGEIKDIGWSSQIRTYVFHPYNMVKDHRTNTELGNIGAVMDGNIDTFINAFLHWQTKGQ